MPSFQISDTVVLRTLTQSDAPDLFALVENNRQYLRQWLPWLDATVQEQDTANFIKRVTDQHNDQKGFQCGMFLGGTLVGMCGFHPIDLSNDSVVIGYWIAEDRMGQGIVTSCVEFLVSYAFEKLDLNKVCIPAAEGNAKSRAIPERLNFVNEGIERAAENLYGRYVNHVRYSVLRNEWIAAGRSATSESKDK